MTEAEGLDVLFFELASENRLDILRGLCHDKLKMQDIARKLNLTATEASRQLQRLSTANLIERSPDSTYQTTHYGKLILSLSTSMEFAFMHTKFFSEHNVWKLPTSYVHRLGELSASVLIEDLNEAIVRWEELVKTAADHLWVMTPEVMPLLSRATRERLVHGLKVKSIVFEGMSERSKASVTKGQTVERRYLSDVPAIILASEKEASISLPLFDGNMHHASFFCNDAESLRWVNELFCYYWENAKKYI